MLYVSRVFGEWNVAGVVDTDDNTETFIRFEEALMSVSEYGLEINGVIANSTTQSVSVWQPSDSKSALQVKFKVMYDADIIIYDGEIVGIHIGLNAPYRVSVVASDFANKISGDIQLTWDGDMRSKCRIVIVLDDNVEMTNRAISAGTFNLCLDIGAVTKQGVVSSLYMQLIEAMSSAQEFDFWSEFIKDRSGRGFPWFCAAKLSVWLGASYLEDLCAKYDFKSLSGQFETMFKEWFDFILKLRLSAEDVQRLALSIHSRTIFSNMKRDARFKIARKSLDFEYLRAAFLEFIERLYVLSRVKKCAVILFCNFMSVCDCSEELQSRYVTLCHNLADDVLNALSLSGGAD